MLQKPKNSNIILILLGALVAILVACGISAVKVHAIDLQTYDVYYPAGDGSWATYSFQIDPVTDDGNDYKNISINSSYVVFDGQIVCSFGQTYRRYTTDWSVLDGSSDSVNPSTSGTLPAQISSESLYVIVYDPIIDDSAETWYFNLSYPDSTGAMVQSSFTLAVGDLITVEPFGIFANGNELVTYPACDSLAIGDTVREYHSATAPTFSLPYEFELDGTASYFSVYNYLGNGDVDNDEVLLELYYPDKDMNMCIEEFSIPSGTLLEFTKTALWVVGHEEPFFTFPVECNSYTSDAMLQHNSAYIPEGSLPFEIEVNSYTTDTYVYSVYVYEKALLAPVIRYDETSDTIKFSSVDEDAYYRAIIKYPDGTEQIRSIPHGIFEFAPYDVVDKAGEVTIYVQAFVTYDRYTTSSERSNGVFWTAAAPVIEEFYLEENMLHYKFSGTRAVGSIQQNGRTIVENIISGTYVYEINLDGGLYGFTLTAENKYGVTKSDSVDYYVGFANDTNGTFYSVGVIMNKIVDTLDSIKFFGISLWMMLCTSFVITLIIPFICIFVLPSSMGGMSTRGGNSDTSGEYKYDPADTTETRLINGELVSFNKSYKNLRE